MIIGTLDTAYSCRVFLICVNRLVCEAVDMLLRREGIIPLGMATDPETALKDVRSLHPEVIVVEGDATERDIELKIKLACLMHEMTNLRVVYFDLLNNELDVYTQQQRKLVSTQDLVAAICAVPNQG